MVNARFINDTTSVEVTSEQQETMVNVSSQTETKRVSIVSAGDHNNLTGRNLPDQHPIDAITGLRDKLNEVADKTFVFEQGIASDVWEITHNLGKKPSVTVVDTADNVIYPAVQYINENQCVVTFNAGTKGKAYLN